jgi:cell division protein FtsW (lipid II flippase)
MKDQPVDLPYDRNAFIFWEKDKKTSLSFFTHPLGVCFYEGGNMKKNAVRIGLVFLAFVLSLGAYKVYQDSFKEKGAKAIQIIIQDDKQNILFDKVVHTDALTLGDLLDEMVAAKKITVSFEGNKTDVYGRYITVINDVEAAVAGPWWVYGSDNNTECVAAGYCGGIDVNPIHDKDKFTFSLSMGY